MTDFKQTTDMLAINIVSPVGMPVITQQPLREQGIASGTHTTLSVAATGNGPLSYQRYEGLIPSAQYRIAGATNSTFTMPDVTHIGQQCYCVELTNNAPAAATFTNVGTNGVAFSNLVDSPADAATMKYSCDAYSEGVYDIVR